MASDQMTSASSYGEGGLSHGDLLSKIEQDDRASLSVIMTLDKCLSDTNLDESQ